MTRRGLDEMDKARVAISEPWFPAQIDLRVASTEGLDLPLAPNTWTAGLEGWEWLWLGPDEWLAASSDGTSKALIAELERALDGRHRSIVDVSAGRAVIDLAGAGRFELLSHGSGIDLDPRSWSAGMCAQTLLARVPVILQERGHATRVFVRPSFAAWLRSWMSERVADLS
jgi:sarcosine oxidase subunit gamma